MVILYIASGVLGLCLFVVMIYFLTSSTPSKSVTPSKPVTPSDTGERFTVSGCEGEDKPIKCPTNKKITAGNIKYGRWDNNICPHGTVNSSTNPIFKNYPLLNQQEIIQSGVMSGYNSLKDDPYVNVFKHYTVDYTCS